VHPAQGQRGDPQDPERDGHALAPLGNDHVGRGHNQKSFSISSTPPRRSRGGTHIYTLTGGVDVSATDMRGRSLVATILAAWATLLASPPATHAEILAISNQVTSLVCTY
jgi:hypothetical protein